MLGLNYVTDSSSLCIKSVCYRDGMRESNVVTKVFEVEYVTPPELPPEDDDLEFQEDLEKQKTMVTLSVTFFVSPNQDLEITAIFSNSHAEKKM